MTDDARPGATRPPPAWVTATVLVLALALFGAVSAWQARSFGAWHEEISVYPSRAYDILAPSSADKTGAPVHERACAPGDAPRSVFSLERPFWSVCWDGRVFPVMVTPYFAGWLYWPSALLEPWHGGDIFRLRLLGLLLGAATLLLTWALLRRLGAPRLALAGTLLVACCPPFPLLHGLLVHYELVPWLCVLVALHQLAGCPGLAPRARDAGADAGAPHATPLAPGAEIPTRRLALAGLFTGLSLAGNVKALFLLAPLAAMSVLAGVRWTRVRGRQWDLALGAAVLPAVPIAAFAWLDPMRRFDDQVSFRARVFATATGEKLLREPLNLARFWTDFQAYFDSLAGAPATLDGPLSALALGAFATCVYALVAWGVGRARALRGGTSGVDTPAVDGPPTDGPPVVAAALGALLLTFVLVSTFLYWQVPAANYSPVYGVFGLALAVPLLRVARRVERRWPRLGAWPAVAFVGAAALGLVGNSVRRGDPRDWLGLPLNARAERDATRWLVDHPSEGPLLTATYNLAGVLESVSRGALRPVQAHPQLMGCPHTPDDAARVCLAGHWRALLTSPEFAPPLRVLGPAVAARLDEREAGQLWPALEDAVGPLGLRALRERAFATGAGVDVLVLYRIERAGGAAPARLDATAPAAPPPAKAPSAPPAAPSPPTSPPPPPPGP